LFATLWHTHAPKKIGNKKQAQYSVGFRVFHSQSSSVLQQLLCPSYTSLAVVRRWLARILYPGVLPVPQEQQFATGCHATSPRFCLIFNAQLQTQNQ